ncbi:ubiquitin-like-conjugating enzyme atg10 [Anaeramoeba flamelloides]|uniref:Ubiquitin-like-conjugating enzyme ATG10 n=1 Tax=Anaeramoeba flamelloides TaxID=1746091 RepID=A0ABQ8Y3N2_9EUKA|nr:ubiquitin-like-conjugating enzyme atg10 [Anaeramoeba flamelloides]
MSTGFGVLEWEKFLQDLQVFKKLPWKDTEWTLEDHTDMFPNIKLPGLIFLKTKKWVLPENKKCEQNLTTNLQESKVGKKFDNEEEEKEEEKEKEKEKEKDEDEDDEDEEEKEEEEEILETFSDLDEEEIEDQNTYYQTPLSIEYHILYSSTYSCPVLYFNAYRSDGRTLSQTEIWEIIPQKYRKEFEKETNFHFISRKEHPLLELPFFFVHPCNTSRFMQNYYKTKNYLLSWFSVIGPAVGVKVPSILFTHL